MNWNQDTIDSREIIEEIDSLEADFRSEYVDYDTRLTKSYIVPMSYSEWLDSDEADQDSVQSLSELQAFAEEAAQYSDDWEYGATLINDRYTAIYARDMAEEIHDTDFSVWPFSTIDWAEAADQLFKDNYTAIRLGRYVYWVR
jgi:hypothetical protein